MGSLEGSQNGETQQDGLTLIHLEAEGRLKTASVLSVKKEIEAGQEIEDGDEGSVGTSRYKRQERRQSREKEKEGRGPEGPAQPLADGVYTRGAGPRSLEESSEDWSSPPNQGGVCTPWDPAVPSGFTASARSLHLQG